MSSLKERFWRTSISQGCIWLLVSADLTTNAIKIVKFWIKDINYSNGNVIKTVVLNSSQAPSWMPWQQHVFIQFHISRLVEARIFFHPFLWLLHAIDLRKLILKHYWNNICICILNSNCVTYPGLYRMIHSTLRKSIKNKCRGLVNLMNIYFVATHPDIMFINLQLCD